MKRWFTVAVLVAAAAVVVKAHSGASLDASLTGTPFSTIDGSIDAVSGPERTPPSAACSANHIFALRNSANLYYIGANVPETTTDADDALVFYFDGNHNGGAAPDAADRAIRLVGFPDGAGNQSPTTAEIYTGNGTTWATPAAFPSVKYTRAAGRLVVELTVQLVQAPVGFAFLHASGNSTDPNPQDCDNDGITDSPVWPPTLVFGGGDPLAIGNTALFGDLGRNAPIVTFTPPLCCSASDITFSQNGMPMVQPFSQNAAVSIQAQVHNNDAVTDAKNVKVQIRVIKFGTGGGTIFSTAPTDPEIPVIVKSGAATISPVQWTPTAPMHGCIQAEVLAPVEGVAGHSLDDYSIAGGNTQAQFNTDVACLPKGGQKRMMFTAFNPDQKAQTITFITRQQMPRGLEGVTFQMEPSTIQLGPKEERLVALVANVGANVPSTDVPKQHLHVPPTAGQADAVTVTAKAGDRLHLASTGTVDIDAGGPVAPTGADGADVSNTVRGRFLLGGENGGRVGGALIGSFNGFETSFVIGADGTVVIPDNGPTLRLAINDLVEGNRDNTGSGYDVEVFSLPPLGPPTTGGGNPDGARPAAVAAAGPDLPFPQVTITAAVTDQLRIVDKTYRIVRGLGGVTYQLLITDMATPPDQGKTPLTWIIVLILILLAVLIWFLTRKPKTA